MLSKIYFPYNFFVLPSQSSWVLNNVKLYSLLIGQKDLSKKQEGGVTALPFLFHKQSRFVCRTFQ
ncbi:MAG: hypothetical protein RLZ33_440 [Bacteroidota bacterium]|jgi:hypothetical protein